MKEKTKNRFKVELFIELLKSTSIDFDLSHFLSLI